MLKGNRGEWSEIYVFFELLAKGKLYAADENLQKIEDIYYPIIKILRNEANGRWEYFRNSEIKIINGETKETVAKIPFNIFAQKAKLLLEKIRNSEGRTFSIPEIEEFMYSVDCNVLKAESNDKSDITLVVHDLNTGMKPTLGFSVKSRLGGLSTLLNPGKTTNFTYEISGERLNDEEMEKINSIQSKEKIKNKLRVIKQLGCNFTFSKIESRNFELNLQVIDSLLPMIVAELLLYYYLGEGRRVEELTNKVKENNPCKYEVGLEHSFYEYKIKNFLTDVALGMTPSKVWNGSYDASGGYIIVREDGEVLCYHIYNRKDFQEYLLKNTFFDTPSSTRYEYGYIYRSGDKYYIKLNLQIRFM